VPVLITWKAITFMEEVCWTWDVWFIFVYNSCP